MSKENINYKQDRSGWLRGEWDNEPDRKDFRSYGLPCFVHRGPSGHWCGYVGVTKEHPFFGVDYSNCPEKCGEDYCNHSPESVLNVHGGITYANKCQGTLCHIPRKGEDPDVWWFGFDCAHCTDSGPRTQRDVDFDRRHPEFKDLKIMPYRNIKYVENQTRKLAKQLRDRSR